MMEISRWKPRRVFCTNQEDHGDAPGVLHVVKFAQGRIGTAALISEVVCTELIARGGVETLDTRIVRVSDNFAVSCTSKPDIPYEVSRGCHFGTVLRDDVEAGPPMSYDDLAEPKDLVTLWAFDTWLGIIDRGNQGNILLSPTSRGRFRIIAADQSDCFFGASTFAGDFAGVMGGNGRGEAPTLLTNAIFNNGGKRMVEQAVETVCGAVQYLGDAFDNVPAEWWVASGVSRQEVERTLVNRARRLEEILKPSDWENPYGDSYLLIQPRAD